MTAANSPRLSLAAVLATKPGHRPRLIFRTHRGRRGSRNTVSHGRAAINSAIAALVWVFRLSQTSTIGPPSCRWAASSRAA